MLKNGGFEANWGTEESHDVLVCRLGQEPAMETRDNIFTPPGWITWFYHDPDKWDQPEVRDAWKSGDPRRVHSGEKGMLLFTFYRKHNAGFLQQVEVEQGDILRLTAWAHAWSNWHDGRHPDDPRWSDGPGYDAGFALAGTVSDDNWRNFTFCVGIDPTGGTDPLAETVVWGPGAHIYNEYAQVPPVTTIAQVDVITVFLRSKTLWPFKHNDAYWDDIVLTVTEKPPPVEDERGFPRIQYERTYILLPQGAGAEWAQAVIEATWDDHHYTIGSSADDAGVGNLNVRQIIAVNPGEWPGDLAAFYEEHYPGIEYNPVEAQSPTELAVLLRPELTNDITVCQRDSRWADEDLGEVPGGETIGEAGCLLSCLTMMLRQVYRRDITPDLLNQLLAQDGYPFTSDDLLTNWAYTVNLFSAFDSSEKTNLNYRPTELSAWLQNGWLMTLRVRNGAHFVYLENTAGGNFHVIDPWDGKHKTWAASDVCGVRAVRLGSHAPAPPPVPPTPLLIGLHDEAGGDWMRDNEMTGVCLAHCQVREETAHLDFTSLENAGIKVLMRLNWGYADGTGTVPPPDKADVWVASMIATIGAARGVFGFVIGNEWNNPAEWPGGWEHPTHVVTPEYCANLYNRIWRGTSAQVRMTPASLDPYNVVAAQHGVIGDPAEWARRIYSQIVGMEFIALHAKTQTNDPNECWSEAMFTHPPLIGRYLHLRTIQNQLSWIPTRYRPLPIFITECNPQFIVQDVEIGWVPDNAEWVRQACDYLRSQPVAGAMFYRYQIAGDQAPFGLADKPLLLQAIAREIQCFDAPFSILERIVGVETTNSTATERGG